MYKNIIIVGKLVLALSFIAVLSACDPNSKLALFTDGEGYCDEAVVTLANCCKNGELSIYYPTACKDFADGITEEDYYSLSKECKELGGGFGEDADLLLAKDMRSLQCNELLPKIEVLFGKEDGDVDFEIDEEKEVDEDGDIDSGTDGDIDTDVVDQEEEKEEEETICVEGDPCNDNDPCTIDDVCSGGVCQGSEKDCSDLDSDCLEGVCLNGTCTTKTMEDGLDCNDNDPCTENDQCVSGICKGSIVSNDAQVSCDDDNLCTENDVCYDGKCQGTQKQCDAPACKSSTCVEGKCVEENLADDTFCVLENSPCVKTAACKEGACQAKEYKDCSSMDDQCNKGVCNETNGECIKNSTVMNGESCNDNNFCTVDDTCQDGECKVSNAKDCSDGKDCTTDACDEDNDTCTHDLNNGYCFINELCYADGYPNPNNVYCSKCDWNSSTSDWTALSDVECDDGDPCTIDDVCKSGVCNAGDPKDCSALDDECVKGVCAEGGSCVEQNKEDDTGCQDGNICTEGDKCSNGSCVPGAPKDCTSEDTECAIGKCNTETGSCYAAAREDNPTCSDNNPCTLDDYCDGISCMSGNPKDCSNLNGECVTGVCNESDGNCEAQNKDDDTGCTDNNLCTLNDRCVSGQCLPQSNKDCSDGKDCTNDVCAPETGDCSNPLISGNCLIDNTCYANNATHPEDSDCLICNDTYPDIWSLVSGYCYIDGVCIANTTPHPEDSECLICDDTNPDNWTLVANYCFINGSCVANGDGSIAEPVCQYCYADETNGNLYDWTDAAEDTLCTDEDVCTLNDRCVSGVCTPASDYVCPESTTNPCWLPTCSKDSITGLPKCSFQTYAREGESCMPLDANVVDAICTNDTCTGTSLPIDTDESGELAVTRYFTTKSDLTNICLSLNIGVTDPGTIMVSLTSPNGTQVTVHDHQAGSNPLAYELQLSNYSGENSFGLWTLDIVADSATPVTTLNTFTIDFADCSL